MMRRSPSSLKKGPWTTEEDEKLVDYVQKHGHGSWRALPELAGLNRCGKSCRLRWTNYLRPDIKRGKFSEEEENLIIDLHSVLGNKWSAIANRIPGRTDNEIKNFWNTHLKKKLLRMGIDPITHTPRTDLNNLLANLPQIVASANLANNLINSPLDVAVRSLQLSLGHTTSHQQHLASLQMLQHLLQLYSTVTVPANHHNSTLDTFIKSNYFGSASFQDPRIFLEQFQLGFNSLGQKQIMALNIPQVDELQSMPDSINNCQMGISCPVQNFQTNNQMPPLVMASLDRSFNVDNNNKPENTTNQSNISDPSSSLTNFQALEEFMDSESSDYWKDFIEQASSSFLGNHIPEESSFLDI